MRPLSGHQFNQLYAGLLARADRLGRTESTDHGANRSLRKMRITVFVPGLPPDLGVPDLARFEFEEWFRRTSVGWVRIRYNYNYFDVRRGGRWGLHLHPLPASSRVPVPHAICIRSDGSGEGRHYVAHEVELVDAHEQFEQFLAAEAPIECTQFVRID